MCKNTIFLEFYFYFWGFLKMEYSIYFSKKSPPKKSLGQKIGNCNYGIIFLVGSYCLNMNVVHIKYI